MLTAFHVISGPLLQLLGAAAGIVDVQMAELALHGSLLFRNILGGQREEARGVPMGMRERGEGPA
jgi:hypothetical protein